jgi:hypothetical protein
MTGNPDTACVYPVLVDLPVVGVPELIGSCACDRRGQYTNTSPSPSMTVGIFGSGGGPGGIQAIITIRKSNWSVFILFIMLPHSSLIIEKPMVIVKSWLLCKLIYYLRV